MKSFPKNADEIIRLKDAKRSVPKDLWAAYSRFVVSVRDKNGKERWVRNSSKIDEAVESAGYFALRSNVVSDAFEALAIYRQRNMVEQDLKTGLMAIACALELFPYKENCW